MNQKSVSPESNRLINALQTAVKNEAEGKDVSSPDDYPMRLRNKNNTKKAKGKLVRHIDQLHAEIHRLRNIQ